MLTEHDRAALRSDVVDYMHPVASRNLSEEACPGNQVSMLRIDLAGGNKLPGGRHVVA